MLVLVHLQMQGQRDRGEGRREEGRGREGGKGGKKGKGERRRRVGQVGEISTCFPIEAAYLEYSHHYWIVFLMTYFCECELDQKIYHNMSDIVLSI